MGCSESDTDAVTKPLEKIKLSFERFEQVKDTLNEKLYDEAELTASEEWYASVGEAYIQGVTRAHAWLNFHGIKQVPSISRYHTYQSPANDKDSFF